MLVVGIGELLWDMLPTGSHLGGAPANFACIAELLGATGVVVSRVGDDQLGREARAELNRHGVDSSFVQPDTRAPDRNGHSFPGDATEAPSSGSQPTLRGIISNGLRSSRNSPQRRTPSALERSRNVRRQSRETIRRALACSRPECLRILDVNLRAPFDSLEILADSLRRANVLKLNSEELPFVLRASDLPPVPESDAARSLQRQYGLQAVCITRGARGSVIGFAEKTITHPGSRGRGRRYGWRGRRIYGGHGGADDRGISAGAHF